MTTVRPVTGIVDIPRSSSQQLLSPRAVWIPGLALLALGFYYFMSFTLDDPFISFRYADNLVHGHGLVFNPGDRVEGYSNLLWVLLMAAFIKVAPMFYTVHPNALILVAKLLGAACGFGCVALMVRISRLLDPEAGSGASWLRAVPTLFLGTTAYFALWSVSGLETSLYAFLLLLAGELYLRGMRGARACLYGSAAALWAVGATRPEGYFIALAFVLHAMIWGRGSRAPARTRLLWLAALGLGVAGLTLFRLSYYGRPLPNTFYAKMGPYVFSYYERGLSQATEGLARTYGFPLLLLVPFAWSRMDRQREWMLAIFVVLFGVAYLVVSGGDWMPCHRFLIPFLPWMGLLFEGALRAFVPARTRNPARVPGTWQGRRLFQTALGIVVFAICFCVFRARLFDFRTTSPLRPLHKGGTLIQTSYLETGLWLRENLPKDVWVGVGEAGTIAYLAPQRFLDLTALNDATLAQIHRPQTGLALPEGRVAEYVWAKSPHYVVLAGLTVGPDGLRSRYPYVEDLLRDARFRERYVRCRGFGQPPERFDGWGNNFLLYARRDCGCREEENLGVHSRAPQDSSRLESFKN